MSIQSTSRTIFLILSPLLFTGCFSVLQFLSLNADGSLSVKWRLTVSRALSDKKKSPKQGESMAEKLKKARDEIQTRAGDKVTDLRVQEIKTKHEKGMAIELRLLKSVRLKDQDAMPIVPYYEKSEKRLTFFFIPKDKGKSSIPLPPAPPNPKPQNKNTQKNPKADKNPPTRKNGMEEIVKAILSTAHYQIVLGQNLKPKRAYIIGRKDKAKTELPILGLGTQSMIDFPFISYLMSHPKGYDLVIELQ